ncbi:EF-hand domain-containing protein [Brevundimonas subvibrioides]|uniref:EF-hand domain-containing protein n=1 Tax=Brevundimonas subvibrioides TaxID=74313 RepID=UPI0022B4A727|nr:EF-hand domain-containing protein [Brevundimonas subvibrioides]
MRKTLLAAGAASVLAILAGAAVAQTATPAPHGMRADANVDGRISRDEFVQGRVARLTAVDANRDGSVSAEEMRSGFDTRRNQQVSARFDTADTDGNGMLSREEFISAAGQRGERAGRGGHGRGGEHRGWRGAGRGGAERGTRGPVAIADVEARTAAAFARLDQDGDGYVTAGERQAARGEMRQHRQERRAERMAHRAAGTPSPSTAPSE